MYNNFAFERGRRSEMTTESTKFKIFYFIRYFGDALFYPFMTLYFISKGISEHQLGIILAITPITTILVNPMWNYVVKDSRISQLVLKIMTVIEGVLIIVVTQITGFELYALIICLIAFFCSPFIAIQDAFTATYANNNQIEYASLRIYASIAYVLATTVAGIVVLYLNYEYLFIVSGIFFLATAIIAIWIKPLEQIKATDAKPKRNFRSLMKNKNFFKYLTFYTIVVGSVRIGDSFFSVYITNDLGLSAMGMGVVYSAFVLVEVLTIRFLTVKGNQYDEKKLFYFATMLFLLRFISYSFNFPLPIVILMTMIRGVSWGIFIYTHIKYIIKIVKMENITMAVLIITLLYSIFTGVGSILAGAFIETNGYSNFFILQTALIFLGFVSFLVFTPKINQPQIIE
jgi:PPP family 3-phenylpropionic acid transporter